MSQVASYSALYQRKEKTDYICFEDFDILKYHGNINNILSLMDHKETSFSKKWQDDRIITTDAKFIFTSNFQIGSASSMSQRQIDYHDVCHKMFNFKGCASSYVPIPDNQLQLFSLDGFHHHCHDIKRLYMLK